MAAVVAVPLFLRDVYLTLKIGAGSAAEFQMFAKVAKLQVTAGDIVTVATLSSDGQFSSVGSPSYALILEGVQDWTATGLSTFLWTNDGAVADFELNVASEGTTTPTTGAPSMEGQVTLVAGDYGGEVNTYGEMSLELPCVAKPVLKTA
jgi:hypothetical protein